MFRRKNNNHESQENDNVQHKNKINDLRAAIGPLSGRSAQFTTDDCLRRYLEARNWNVEKSKKMLDDSLKWRASFRPEEIRWRDVAVEGETGKIYRANFCDREGRTVLILRPGKQNTSSHENQLRHLVYLLENAILNLPEGQEQMVWLIDFTGWSLTKTVPVKTARETANILQSHYPERLSFAFLFNPPKVFETFWKIIKYFLDTTTFQKVKFIYPKNQESMELMLQNFDPKILPVEFGGMQQHQYDHEEFSQLMEKDDIKLAEHWGLKERFNLSSNGRSSEVAPAPEPEPEPVLVSSVAS